MTTNALAAIIVAFGAGFILVAVLSIIAWLIAELVGWRRDVRYERGMKRLKARNGQCVAEAAIRAKRTAFQRKRELRAGV